MGVDAREHCALRTQGPAGGAAHAGRRAESAAAAGGAEGGAGEPAHQAAAGGDGGRDARHGRADVHLGDGGESDVAAVPGDDGRLDAGHARGGRGGGSRAAEIDEDRKDYLRYLDQLRGEVYDTGDRQRRALEWNHPDPHLLWTLAGTDRMWERRVTDPDYCHVRVGSGSQRLATRLIAPETGPVEDLEPVAAIALRRFVRTHSVVPELPTSVSLRGFAAIGVGGSRSVARDLVRSMLLQLCTFHSPDQVRVAIVCGPDTAAEWEWTKWLPHTANPDVVDGVGAGRGWSSVRWRSST